MRQVDEFVGGVGAEKGIGGGFDELVGRGVGEKVDIALQPGQLQRGMTAKATLPPAPAPAVSITSS